MKLLVLFAVLALFAFSSEASPFLSNHLAGGSKSSSKGEDSHGGGNGGHGSSGGGSGGIHDKLKGLLRYFYFVLNI